MKPEHFVSRDEIYTDDNAPCRFFPPISDEEHRLLIAESNLPKSKSKVGEAPIVRDDSFGEFHLKNFQDREDKPMFEKVSYPDHYGDDPYVFGKEGDKIFGILSVVLCFVCFVYGLLKRIGKK